MCENLVALLNPIVHHYTLGFVIQKLKHEETNQIKKVRFD